MIRDKSPLFHSFKINTEILGLTVLPVSSSDHKLIKNSVHELDQDSASFLIIKGFLTAVEKQKHVWLDTCRYGHLHTAQDTYVYLYSLHSAIYVTSAVSAHIPLFKCFQLGSHIREDNTGTTLLRRTEARDLTVYS